MFLVRNNQQGATTMSLAFMQHEYESILTDKTFKGWPSQEETQHTLAAIEEDKAARAQALDERLASRTRVNRAKHNVAKALAELRNL
jgi:hypothetical protein